MRYLALLALGAGFILMVPPAEAGLVGRACMRANPTTATPELCGCIQKVADVSLNPSERKMASKFFDDPHQAHILRQSDRRSDEIFWERYKLFGEKARKDCG